MAQLRLHPDYLDSRTRWKTIADFVDGSTERVLKYLIPHASEAKEDADSKAAWTARRRRTENENDVAPPRAILLSYLSRPINFGELSTDPDMSARLKDVDGFGTTAEDMARRMCEGKVDDGVMGVLIEAEGSVGVGGSRVEDPNNPFRSYQTPFCALEIYDWSRFKRGARRGQLSSVTLSLGMETDANGERYESIVRYSIGETGNYEKQMYRRDEKAEEKNGILEVAEVGPPEAGSLDRIPFVFFGFGITESKLAMAAQYSKKLLNKISERENVEYFQAYQRTIMTGVQDATKIKTLSENTVTVIPNPDAQVHTIEPGNPDALRVTATELRLKLTRDIMGQYHQAVAQDSAQVQSADSKALDMVGLLAWLNKTLDQLVVALQQIYSIQLTFEGRKDFNVAISIARDFGIEDDAKVVAKRGTIFSRAGQVGVREIQKQILKQDLQALGNLVRDKGDETGDVTRERLMAEIENAEDPLAAGVGAPGQRPGILSSFQ